MEHANEPHRIKEVVVLGGGSAGWLAALYLRQGLHPETRITVVQSPKVPIVGVGEATVPTIRSTLGYFGLVEQDWMPHCEATYKLAVRFNDWLRLGHSYYHPFWYDSEISVARGKLGYFLDLADDVDVLHAYCAIPRAQRTTPLASYACPIPKLCDEQKSPHLIERRARTVSYAYHFDAALIANYLEGIGAKRGIRVVRDHVVGASLDERGFITALKLESGQTVPGEFFIDCSGFSAQLLNGVLNEPFLSAAHYLPCTAAVATQVPYRDHPPKARPYTNASARGAGWIWEIPLRHRTGSGYVYSPAHVTADQAEAELRAFHRLDDDVRVNHIKARVGRNRNVWVKNCVAMGLAGSFVEPLESTSIVTTEYQLFTLLRMFPDRRFDEVLIRRYNEKFAYFYDQIRDFIVLHYHLTEREDTAFWRSIRHEIAVPDSVKAFLDGLPGWIAASPREPEHNVFPRFSYACILDGMDRLPELRLPILDHHRAEIDTQIAAVREREATLLGKLPDHLEYFRQTEAMARG